MSFMYSVGIIWYMWIYVVSSHESAIHFSEHNCSIINIRQISTVKADMIIISNCSLKTLPNAVFLSHTSCISLHIFNSDLEKIEDFALNGLKCLEIISIYQNHLTKISSWSEHDLVNVHKLDLYQNNIQTISLKAFQHYPNLETINLSLNNLTNIPENIFKYTPQLRNINLAKNHLTRIESFTFKELFELTHISLEHNDIDFVDSFAFANNVHLKSIRLDFNKIVIFDTLVLFNCQRLSYINLSYNALTTINEDTFKRSFHLKILDISGNQFAEFEENSFSGLINLEIRAPEYFCLARLRSHVFCWLFGYYITIVEQLLCTAAAIAFKVSMKRSAIIIHTSSSRVDHSFEMPDVIEGTGDKRCSGLILIFFVAFILVYSFLFSIIH